MPGTAAREIVTLGRYRIESAHAGEYKPYGPEVAGQALMVAEDKRNSERVLLRCLEFDAEVDHEARERLKHEASGAVDLRHPASLAVREVGQEDGLLVFVQSYPHGPLLRKSVAAQGPFKWPQALKAVRPFLQALSSASGAGFMMPLVSPDDFALDGPEGVGRRRVVCLSPPVPQGWSLQLSDAAYVCPEVAAGHVYGEKSELYATGALICYMIAGRTATAHQKWHDLLLTLNLPKEVCEILWAMLENDPDRRPKDAEEVCDRVDKVLAGVPASAAATPAAEPSSTIISELSPAQARAAEVTSTRTKQPLGESVIRAAMTPVSATARSRTKMSLGLMSGATLLICVLLVWLALRPQTPDPVIISTASTPVPAPAPVVEREAEADIVLPVAVALQPGHDSLAANTVREQAQMTPTLADIPADGPPGLLPPPLRLDGTRSHFPIVRELPETAVQVGMESLTAGDLTAASMPSGEPVPAPFDLFNPAAPAATFPESLSAAPKLPQPLPDGLAATREQVLKKVGEGKLSEADSKEMRSLAMILKSAKDPVGSFVLGYLSLREAESATRLKDSTRALSAAVPELRTAMDAGHPKSGFYLIQACLNLHNMERQAGNHAAAERASTMLTEVLSQLPESMPTTDLRLLAEQLEQVLNRREQEGRPHPQTVFMRMAATKLQALADARGA